MDCRCPHRINPAIPCSCVAPAPGEEGKASDRQRSVEELGDRMDLYHKIAELSDALTAAQAEVERLNTWDGLLSVLDEHYPAEVFEKSSDPGARIVTLTRALAAAREENGRLRDALEMVAVSEADLLSVKNFARTFLAALALEATDAE